MKKVLLINSSTRKISNSRLLAYKVLEGIIFNEVNLRNYCVNEVKDFRSSEYWPCQNDDYYKIIKLLINSDIIVFSTPIYWYGISGLLKNFIDRWSESLKTNTFFRKKMGMKSFVLVLVGGDNPLKKASIIKKQFQYIAEFFNAKFIDCVIGQSNTRINVFYDFIALSKAEEVNIYLKSIIKE